MNKYETSFPIRTQPLSTAEPATPLPRIIVVEDEDAVRFNLSSYLEDSGFDVRDTDDSAEALAWIRQSPPDLVLSDLWMPGMGGAELVRILHNEMPDLPVVVVSGTGVLSDAVSALRDGAWDFVAKPIPDMAVLEHSVRKAMEKARLIRENRAYHAQLEQMNEELREHLQQLEQDAEAGRQMQMQLIPSAEQQIHHYHFDRTLLPSLHLSGDFVDYFPIDRQRICFYLADVSGHGVSSALVTVMLCSFVRQLRESLHQGEDQSLLDPAATLTRINQYLLEQKLDKYLTLFMGVIDTGKHQLSYCNGGHFPEPLMTMDSDAHYLSEKSLPLGLMGDVSYRTTTVGWEENATLVVCSDGVLELLPQLALSDKRKRLQHAVAETPFSVTALLDELDISPDQRYPDDVTLLLIQRRQPDAGR